jgi:hypothetical protein
MVCIFAGFMLSFPLYCESGGDRLIQNVWCPELHDITTISWEFVTAIEKESFNRSVKRI